VKARYVIATLLAFVLMAPYGVNILGTSVYLYTHLGLKDFVIGSAWGTLHIALADPINFTTPSINQDFYTGLTIESHSLGPFEIFTEHYENAELTLSFAASTEPDYMFFELPWFFLLIIPLAIALIPGKKQSEFTDSPPN